jgi:hypothetical protein
MKHLPLLLNVVVYQCVWFACVLGAAARQPLIGIALALVAVLLHLSMARDPLRELPVIGLAMVAGAGFDSLLVATGLVRMDQAVLTGGVLPLWMVALWAAFATTLNVSLRALRGRYLLSATIAAVGAPLAYSAGAGLGALQIGHWLPALLAIGMGWALLLPLLMKSAQRFDGFAAP